VERLHAACAVAADRLMELISEPAWSDDDGQRDKKAEGRASGG
jgi:hypothetical protein